MSDKNTEKNIFREKSIESLSGPEELNDYIRVTTPSVWLVLIALFLLLLGMLCFCIFGTVETHKEDGSVEEVHPISFVIN